MAGGNHIRAIQRIAGADGALVPAQRAIKVCWPLAAVDVPETAPGSTLSGSAGGDGEITGHTEIRMAASGPTLEAVFLAHVLTPITAVEATPALAGIRVLHDVPGAASATFVVNIVKDSGGGSVFADLYDLDTSTVIATVSTTSTTLVELTAVVSGILGSGDRRLAVRAYVEAGSELSIGYASIRYR